ncbi:MAG: hypothetical protein AB1486_00930 [Planctomycetota bacterium]
MITTAGPQGAGDSSAERRELHTVALERFCERVLSEVVRLAGDTSKSSHKRYLALYKLIHRRDHEIEVAFNDTRRSTAQLKLRAIHSLGLLTHEELARFSPQIRAMVQSVLDR